MLAAHFVELTDITGQVITVNVNMIAGYRRISYNIEDAFIIWVNGSSLDITEVSYQALLREIRHFRHEVGEFDDREF